MKDEEEVKGFRYKSYFVSTGGEYPVVNKIIPKKDGDGETLRPTYFPRDIKGAFETLLRITSTDASRACKELKDCVKKLDENYKDLLVVLQKELK